jgi:hypothetical protein
MKFTAIPSSLRTSFRNRRVVTDKGCGLVNKLDLAPLRWPLPLARRRRRPRIAGEIRLVATKRPDLNSGLQNA